MISSENCPKQIDFGVLLLLSRIRLLKFVHIKNWQLFVLDSQVYFLWRTLLFLRALRPWFVFIFLTWFQIFYKSQLFQNMLHQFKTNSFICQVGFIQNIARHVLPQFDQFFRKFWNVVLFGFWSQRALLFWFLLTWRILLSHYFIHLLLLLYFRIFEQTLVYTTIIAAVASCRFWPRLHYYWILRRGVILQGRNIDCHLTESVYR